MILWLGFANTRDELFRHDEDVDRSLRLDVIKGGDEIVLIHQRSWDLSIDDLLKDGFFSHDLAKKLLLADIASTPTVQAFDFVDELAHVFKLAVNGGVAHISHVIHGL